MSARRPLALGTFVPLGAAAALAAGPGVLAPGRLLAQRDAPPPIRPTRSTVANDAEPHRPGVLQAEAGYAAYGRSDDAREQQAASVLLRYAFSSRLLAHVQFDPFEHQIDPDGRRSTGPGDVRLLGQGVLVPGGGGRPALALAYETKLPTTPASRGLGTGRADHRVALLLSGERSGTSVDVNVAYLNDGRPGGPGRVAGGQWALDVAREPEQRGWGTQWEVATENLDADEPRGTFALGAATYHTSEWVRLDAGVRVGLTRGSPRTELFAGVTTGAALRRR